MSKTVNLKPTLEFLDQLQDNNNRAWFEEKRAAYENAREAFEAFVGQLIGRMDGLEDMHGVRAKDCVMRIFRDVRFSKDKSPYRTNMGASIGPGGKKSTLLSYYLHLAPHDGSMIAGGLYKPESAQLARFRAAIDRNAKPFKALINHRDFTKYFGTLEGEMVKTAPQGYAREHPEIELLKLKQVVAVHPLSDETVLSPKFVSYCVKAFTALKPFLDYLNAAVQ